MSNSLLPSINLSGGVSFQTTPPVIHQPQTNNISGAQTDEELISLWLFVKSSRSKHTKTAYTKEAERLLRWLKFFRLSLKDVTIVHAQAYLHQLEHPASEQTPLSPSSINYTRRVLSNLFSYAADCGYIQSNPMKMTAAATEVVKTSQHASIDNYLELKTWQWLLAWMNARPCDTDEEQKRKDREIWMLTLLYHTGIRREEAAKAMLSDVAFDNRSGTWRLKVLGKGNKLRYVTLNSACMSALSHYLDLLGCDMNSNIPLIPRVRGNIYGRNCVTPRFIGLSIQNLRDAAAVACPPEMREELANMTTHWLRHTNATHRLSAGADLTTTQTELGHANINTTRIYAADDGGRRKTDAEHLAKYADH